MLKRSLVPIFLASIAGLALLTFLAASANSSPDPGLFRSNQTINRVTKPDPQLPALPGAGRVEIRGYEAGGAQNTPLGSALGDTANTQAGPDTFYGNETLYPLIDAGTMIIPLPGGARVEIRDGETTYVLTDHLGSARVVLREDNTVSGRIEYTPFGERRETGEADVVRSFTGKVFEPETGTYDFHAREYDPSSGRFTSVDAARKSISPYSYASNNPINKVDPDGLWPVYFWMYSKFGTDKPDSTGNKSLEPAVVGRKTAIYSSGQLVKVAKLEDKGLIPRGEYDEVQHLTVTQQGGPEEVHISYLDTDAAFRMKGEEFARYLYERLEAKSEGSSGKLRSILLEAPYSAYDPARPLDAGNQSGRSFADRFAGRGQELFPQLEHVFATPYEIVVAAVPGDDRTLSIEVHERGNNSISRFLRLDVNAEQYYSGNLPSHVREAPRSENVKLVGVRISQAPYSATQPNDITYDDSFSIGAFMDKPGFTEPIFREIPVRPLIGPLTD